MLSILYPISYTISLLGLILWFYNQDNPRHRRLMSQAFLGGFVVYTFSLAFADGAVAYKLLVLFRDMVVLGSVALFFNFFRKYKVAFFGLLFLAFGVFRFTYYEKLQNTFPQKIDESIDLSENISSSETWYQLDKNGELLVEVKEGNQMNDLQNLVEKYNLQYELAFHPELTETTDLDDYYVVNVPDNFDEKIEEIENAFLESGLVDWVEGNEVINISPVENLEPSQRKRVYGVNDPGIQQQWGFDEMRMDELYNLLKTNEISPQKKANIFILDTGVDAKHEDLKDNYKSHKKKYDTDKHGHGTHCAGIAAAVTNNKKGVASYAPNNDFVNVSSVKVLADFGGGTQRGIISGMLEAADAGADVISMSLGGPSNRSRQRAYARAVSYCNRRGAIVIAAAGNSNIDASKYSPANAPGIITVAAVDTFLNRAHFSNYVQNVPKGIAAPGVKIYSTFPGDQYRSFNGTSMACPYVAGLVGLMKSIRPELTTEEVYKILKKTGRDTRDTHKTGKLIQPALAVKELL